MIAASVREMLEAAGFNDKLDCRTCLYLSIHDAVVAAINKHPSIRRQVSAYSHVYWTREWIPLYRPYVKVTKSPFQV